MDPVVFAAVLFAAACHAGWNAVIKVGLDPFAATALIAVGAGVVAAPLVPFVGIPVGPAWPWLIASVILHLFYYIGLIEAYRARSDRPAPYRRRGKPRSARCNRKGGG